MVNQITNEFASGKIYVSTNNMTNVKSYLAVKVARKSDLDIVTKNNNT